MFKWGFLIKIPFLFCLFPEILYISGITLKQRYYGKVRDSSLW